MKQHLKLNFSRIFTQLIFLTYINKNSFSEKNLTIEISIQQIKNENFSFGLIARVFRENSRTYFLEFLNLVIHLKLNLLLDDSITYYLLGEYGLLDYYYIFI